MSASLTLPPPGPSAGDIGAWVRAMWLTIAMVAIGSVAVAVGLQHLGDLEPCPLCILQRYAHLAVGAAALLAALAPRWTRGRGGPRVAGAAAVLAALAGGAVASHQVWMQHNPLISRCSRQVFELVNERWLAEVLPGLFRGAGDCLADNWHLFGLSMPAWSLVLFCAYLIAAVPALALSGASGSAVATSADVTSAP